MWGISATPYKDVTRGEKVGVELKRADCYAQEDDVSNHVGDENAYEEGVDCCIEDTGLDCC